MEGVDRLGVRTPKATWAPLTVGRPRSSIQKKGFGPCSVSLPKPARPLELHQQADPERLEGLFVEGLAAGEVGDLESDVIEHALSLSVTT